LVEKWTLLTKSLLPLPEKFHGLHDIETKLRKRYLDILLNEDVKNMVKRRSMYFKSIRDFLNLK
jgi:lysyl-tRNA synthetase class 2